MSVIESLLRRFGYVKLDTSGLEMTSDAALSAGMPPGLPHEQPSGDTHGQGGERDGADDERLWQQALSRARTSYAEEDTGVVELAEVAPAPAASEAQDDGADDERLWQQALARARAQADAQQQAPAPQPDQAAEEEDEWQQALARARAQAADEAPMIPGARPAPAPAAPAARQQVAPPARQPAPAQPPAAARPQPQPQPRPAAPGRGRVPLPTPPRPAGQPAMGARPSAGRMSLATPNANARPPIDLPGASGPRPPAAPARRTAAPQPRRSDAPRRANAAPGPKRTPSPDALTRALAVAKPRRTSRTTRSYPRPDSHSPAA